MKSAADKFELFAGFKNKNNVDSKIQVGAAFKENESAHYKLKLMMFPGHTYYLVKNRECVDRYTIYSRMIENENQCKFLNPVGSGLLDSKLQYYMELRFPLLRTTLFMSLFPVTV